MSRTSSKTGDHDLNLPGQIGPDIKLNQNYMYINHQLGGYWLTIDIQVL